MRGIILDMDGVLLDVRKSYYKAIYETVKIFTKKSHIKEKQINMMVDYLKNLRGFNCEWRCTDAIIKYFENNIDYNFEVFIENFYSKRKIKEEIVSKFERIYKKYRDFERPILGRYFLERLKKDFKVAVFTGRMRDDAIYGLNKIDLEPDFIITAEDYKKPSGLAIKEIFNKLGLREAIYIGDSMDDFLSVKEAKEKYKLKVYFISFRRELKNCNFFARNTEDIKKILKKLKWI